MSKYQNKRNGMPMYLFKQCFGDMSMEDQLRMADTLGKITQVCK